MFQAIVTAYHGPTNSKGARITASAEAGRKTLSYDHAVSCAENHKRAARALASKFKWDGTLHSGSLPDGRYAHVFEEDL